MMVKKKLSTLFVTESVIVLLHLENPVQQIVKI